MLVPVREILGLGGVPKDRTAATRWLQKVGCELITIEGDARRPQAVSLAALPPDVRRALHERAIEYEGLEQGERDEAAHRRFEASPPKMRAKAERLAQIAYFLIKCELLGWTKNRAFEAVRARFGDEGNSTESLYRILKDVRGVDPINFAPALLDKYTCLGRPPAANWDEAWQYALAKIAKSGEEWPLAAAYDRLVAIKDQMGWKLPSQSVFYKRWRDLPTSVRLTAQYGAEKAQEMLMQPALRDRSTILPMDIWSLDGRKLDFWVEWEGEIIRPIELRLIDVATGKILASRLCKTENAIDTVALILEAVRAHGIPKKIGTDNSRAFSAHLVAGGASFKFRQRLQNSVTFKPPGVCTHLGIEITFALPRRGRSKLVERSFAETGKRIDCAPEFSGAYAGSKPEKKPSGKVKPVPFEMVKAVFDREFAAHNTRIRRGGVGKGRSFDQAFADGCAIQIPRMATERQLYLASLIYKPVSVTKFGRFSIGDWTYGGPDTQDALLAFFDHRRGRAKDQILVGIDPNDYSQPAVAYDRDGYKIAEDIQPIIAGEYVSRASANEAARYGKAARKATKVAQEALRQRDAALERRADAAYQNAAPTAPSAPVSSVVQPRFNAPLRERPTEKGQVQTEARIANWLKSPKVEAR